MTRRRGWSTLRVMQTGLLRAFAVLCASLMLGCPPGDEGKAKAQALKRVKFDIDAMGKVGMEYERLDQLLTELMMGIR